MALSDEGSARPDVKSSSLGSLTSAVLSFSVAVGLNGTAAVRNRWIAARWSKSCSCLPDLRPSMTLLQKRTDGDDEVVQQKKAHVKVFMFG